MYHLFYLLHYRADSPRHKFPVSQPLGAGPPARSHLQHKIENLSAHLRHGFFVIADRSGVDVHVVLMRRYISLLLEILITGTVGNPMALPRPVVNASRVQPPAARPVMDTGS